MLLRLLAIWNQIPPIIPNLRTRNPGTAVTEWRIPVGQRGPQPFRCNLLENILSRLGGMRPSIIFSCKSLQNLSAHQLHAYVYNTLVGRQHLGVDPRQTIR